MPEQIRLKVRIMIFTMVHSHLAVGTLGCFLPGPSIFLCRALFVESIHLFRNLNLLRARSSPLLLLKGKEVNLFLFTLSFKAITFVVMLCSCFKVIYMKVVP